MKKVIDATREIVRRVNVTSQVDVEIGSGYEIRGFQWSDHPAWNHTGTVYSTSFSGASHMCTINTCMRDTENPLIDIARALEPWFTNDADRLEVWYRNRFIGIIYPTDTGIKNRGCRSEKHHKIFAPADIAQALKLICADAQAK